jgi:hypothetical protein
VIIRPTVDGISENQESETQSHNVLATCVWARLWLELALERQREREQWGGRIRFQRVYSITKKIKHA